MTWTRERWAQIEALFHEVAQRQGAARSECLDAACGPDRELRAAVARLLAADGNAEDDLLEQGVMAAWRGKDPMLQSRFGPFQLVERIADGGMGSVYRAVRADGDFDQDVAVKVLRLGFLTAPMRARFARERQTLARLIHPNVARLLDGGTTDLGLPFFAMELVDGVPIDRFCDERKATLRQRLELFATVCRAVHFAHQNLVVHLDLKPSNILVDGHGVPKLLDFGVAGLLEEVVETTPTVAATRSRPLTPEYASPEQLRGEPVSTAADVYALGVVLYELLTGTRPFLASGSGDLDLARRICATDAPRPSATFATQDAEAGIAAVRQERAERRGASVGELVRSLRGDLDRIVAMAMRKEPGRRYSSGREFADDIDRYLRGFPVVAREAGVGYRLAKFVRRNVVLVSAAGIVVLALVGGIAATSHMAHVARGERDAAAAARTRVEQEMDHARVETASSRLVASFLGDTFLSAEFVRDPHLRDSVLAAIQRKAAQVRRQYSDHAHLRANLLDALGRACAEIDAFEPAESLIREATSLRIDRFGPDHLEHALSLASLGQLYYRQGRFQEAVDVLRQGYRLHQALPADVHTDVALAANDLAAAERACGNRDRARELHLEALALRRAGGDPVLVAESLNNLANSESDPVLAGQYLAESLQIRAEVLGSDDPLTIQSSMNLGILTMNRGQHAEAQPLLREAIEASRRIGSLGVDVLSPALGALAYTELRLGNLDAAERAIDEALATDLQRFGAAHVRVARDHEVRALILGRRAAWPAAVEAWREVLRILRAALPDRHQKLADTLCSLGAALAKADCAPEAIVVLGEALTRYQAITPPPVVDIADTKVNLACALERTNRFDEAERALLEALSVYENDPTKGATIQGVRRELHEFYRRRGQPEMAARYAVPATGENDGSRR